jgi:phosphatidylinositol-3-phosphatase
VSRSCLVVLRDAHLGPSFRAGVGRLSIALAAALACLVLAGCGSHGGQATGASPSPPPPQALCGQGGGHDYRHVLVVVFENHSYGDLIGSPEAPFLNSLADRCGLATNYFAVTHPSLPNYLALTSGQTWGVTDDASPSAHPLPGPSIYSQLADAGKSWREYEEDAPGNCPQAEKDGYAVKHDPAAYFTDIRSTCNRWDVPLPALWQDLAQNRLPDFGFVTPNLCHDMHDCSRREGDAWLAMFVARVTKGAAYRAGTTALFVVWDEDEHNEGNRVPLVVVAPSTPKGARFAGHADHYATLRTWEDILGLPCLARACGSPSLRHPFGL